MYLKSQRIKLNKYINDIITFADNCLICHVTSKIEIKRN